MAKRLQVILKDPDYREIQRAARSRDMSATNVYTETKYTPAHREASEELLRDWYGQFLSGIAAGRRLKAAEVKAAVEKGPFSSEEALSAKLVDRVAYSDESRDFVKRKAKGSEERLSAREYLRRRPSGGRSKLAVIYATGVIVPGSSGTVKVPSA